MPKKQKNINHYAEGNRRLLKYVVLMFIFMGLALGLSFASMITFNYTKTINLKDFHLIPGKIYTIFQLTNITDSYLIMKNTSYIKFSPTSHGTANISLIDVLYNETKSFTVTTIKGASYPIKSLNSIISVNSVTDRNCTVNITIYIQGYEHKLSFLAIPGMIAALVSLALMFKLLINYTLSKIPVNKKK